MKVVFDCAKQFRFFSVVRPHFGILVWHLEIKEHKQGLEIHETKYRPRNKTAQRNASEKEHEAKVKEIKSVESTFVKTKGGGQQSWQMSERWV